MNSKGDVEVKLYLKAVRNEVMEGNRQLAVVLGSNVTKREAARWAQYIVDRENSVRRTENMLRLRVADSAPK